MGYLIILACSFTVWMEYSHDIFKLLKRVGKKKERESTANKLYIGYSAVEIFTVF